MEGFIRSIPYIEIQISNYKCQINVKFQNIFDFLTLDLIWHVSFDIL
jgi:hypothetical protein